MRGKLVVASIWTLGLLFGMLAAIILLVLYSAGSISVGAVFGLTILINLVSWLLSPRITDWIQKFFYKTVYYDQAAFTQSYPQYAAFIADSAQKNNTPFPKIGFINDDNPTAFSYGSGRWNARIVFTQGLFTYLEEDEVKAVLAHELGHIVHRDFIVMSIANTIIQLLYEAYYILARGKKDKDSGRLAIIGWVAYFFYWIGLYIVLYLNRLREYYADEFSAQTNDPEALSRALVKVAYGIMAKEDSASSTRLLESTKTMGIMSLQTAKSAGLAVKVSGMAPDKVAKVMLFDVVSPWAKLAELSATHPLTGKRLRRLDELGQAAGKPPVYNIEAARQLAAIDNRRLWRGFIFGSFMYLLPILSFLLAVVIAVVVSLFFTVNDSFVGGVILIMLPVFLILFVGRVFYRYPSVKSASPADVYSLMTDLYANPVRGKAVQMNGAIVGRGIPGYVFGEDMMLQDNTGLLYLNYEGPFSFISNLVFALKKFKKFLGQSVKARGWFYRSNTQYLQLNYVEGPTGRVKSYPRLWGFVGAVLLAFGLSFLTGVLVASRNTSASGQADSSGSSASTSDNTRFTSSTGDVSNKCYSLKVPPSASLTKSSVCNLYIDNMDFSDTTKSVSASIDVSPQTSPSFDQYVVNWKNSDANLQVQSDDKTTLDGLPAERIMYVFKDAPNYPAVQVYIDASSRIKSKYSLYVISINASSGTQKTSAVINDIINSFKVKQVVFSQ